MSLNNAKTTIHVTNLPDDKSSLWSTFSELEGFRRVSFHQDFCFVCFDEISYATQAIDFVQNSTHMVASYAKHGLSTSNSSSVNTPPNRILYMSLSPFFMEKQWNELLRTYEGFEAIKFFASYGLARFSSIDCATDALEDILERTNLSLTYSKIKLASSDTTSDAQNSSDLFSRSFVSLSATSFPAPKKTIHVTNMDRDRSLFFKILLQFPGFDRVAFYNDYSFVCFQDVSHAVFAIDEIMTKTKMKASFAKVDFIHHSVAASQIGTPNSILRISDFPSNMTHAELIGIFQTLEGFLNATQFYVASCLVHFKSQECARQALERLNHSTNMTAIYSIKGIKETDRPVKVTKAATELPALYPLPIRPRPLSAPNTRPGTHQPGSSNPGEGGELLYYAVEDLPLEERGLLESTRNGQAHASNASLASSTLTDLTYKESSPEELRQGPNGQQGLYTESIPLLSQAIPPPLPNVNLQLEDTKRFLHSLVHRLHFLEHENALLRASLMGTQEQQQQQRRMGVESGGSDELSVSGSVIGDDSSPSQQQPQPQQAQQFHKKGMLFEPPTPSNVPFLGAFYSSNPQSQVPSGYHHPHHRMMAHNNSSNGSNVNVWGPPRQHDPTAKSRFLSGGHSSAGASSTVSNVNGSQSIPSGMQGRDESQPHLVMLQGLLDLCE